MKVIAFFNNKGGVGKTSLVYHVAWMLSETGKRVLAIDLDPQANLSGMFLGEDRLEKLWPDDEHPQTILGCIAPILKGLGDVKVEHVEMVQNNLGLVVGDLGLSRFEDKLSDAWPRCLDNDEAAYRAITAFHRIVQTAAEKMQADHTLIDVGPNLGAINRAAMIATDCVVMPLAPDLFSLQGLKNLGPTLKAWRKGWEDRLKRKSNTIEIDCPKGDMTPLGYIIMQHAIRDNRPVKAYSRWIEQIPIVYQEHVLGRPENESKPSGRLGLIKHYRSLMPMAQEARKPIFLLRSADGAIGAHSKSVSDCYMDFKKLSEAIIQKSDLCNPMLPGFEKGF
jgi:cellulose biosynthesis protein BcsQ